MAIVTETKVANRALQRCGSTEIAAGLLWTEDSKQAREIRNCYDFVRRAEMRRNVWRFSIRSSILRPMDDDTRLVTWANWAVGVVTSAEIDYPINEIVMGSDGLLWQSRVTQAFPSTDPSTRDFSKWTPYVGPQYAQPYDDEVTYMAGDLVYVTTEVYLSLQNNNEDNLVSDTDFWFKFAVDAQFTNPTLSAVSFVYPIGAGPASNTQLRNVFPLPYGWLREAAQSPRQGSYMPLGAPNSLPYTDWNYESDFITASDPGPIAYRFAADIEDPMRFDPMFAEGLSCRLAIEVCEPLTQSRSKIDQIGGEYKLFMTEARLVNAIENGTQESPEDSYLSCRV